VNPTDSTLIARARELLAAVIDATLDHAGGGGHARGSTGLHALAAAEHLRLGVGRDRPQTDVEMVEVVTLESGVEMTLRDALHQLVRLTPATFDSDAVLDAVSEIQAALAATG
jgi:hypothetical protein